MRAEKIAIHGIAGILNKTISMPKIPQRFSAS
jgi:hypothetical protein